MLSAGWGGRAPHALALAALVFTVVLPSSAGAAQPAAQYVPAPPARLADDHNLSVPVPAPKKLWSDADAGVSFVLPTGWVVAPGSSLNPVSDPPEPYLEIARFQQKIGEPSLYAVPLQITSPIVRDAGAIISISLAREGTDLAGLEADPATDAVDGVHVPGFTVTEEDSVYDDMHILARYLISNSGDRVVVLRVYTPEEEWSNVAPVAKSALLTARADPAGANAAPPPPPPPPPVAIVAPEPPQVVRDASLERRDGILARAASLLGTPYVWGGNSPGRGMDCSAYVSWVWSVSRYTTDSIGNVSSFITKEELRAGDAMNLTIGRDPARKGHIRLFEAWANPEHTLVWVYEETPPRAVHRVIAYDNRYQPIRLDGLSGAGAAKLLPAPITQPERVVTPRRTVTQTPRTYRTPAPTVRPTQRPAATPRGAVYFDPRSRTVITGGKDGTELRIGVAPTPTPRRTATPKPAVKATATARPTVRPTVRPSARPTATARPPTANGTRRP